MRPAITSCAADPEDDADRAEHQQDDDRGQHARAADARAAAVAKASSTARGERARSSASCAKACTVRMPCSVSLGLRADVGDAVLAGRDSLRTLRPE